MQLIHAENVQHRIDSLKEQELYVHLEMTTGAYAAHLDSTKHPAANFITNAMIRYSHGSIAGNGPYRVGLKMEHGWIYTEGLTHWEENETDRLLLAGHDAQGKLIVSLQLSREPF
ncbi:YojF family protein [Candidatus Pristimantibacillus sp. PTI5]|uniref:YojF family protein n=1 Tax=Candidatus Pristimantibacillus sp. PTI5 TaxID=3400422 RepID=UPI003B020849